MPQIPFVTTIIRALIWSVTFLFVQVIGKVVLKSIGDAYKLFGILGFLFWLSFVSGLVYVYYQSGDITQAVYAVICILVIHLSLWGMGYFERA
jgi:hypothetical protein